jgi:hypothetical protein
LKIWRETLARSIGLEPTTLRFGILFLAQFIRQYPSFFVSLSKQTGPF